MKELACQFGPEHNLVGILNEPVGNDARPDNPAVLVLNAGLLHRVGPQRMSVELARRLADLGIRCLRFDMGGYGDSEVSTEAKSDDTRIFSDIKDAMDFLEREHNVHRFVLFGSCSGADNSHAVALRDPRVAGAILLDGHGYWTLRSYVIHYLPRVFRPQVWINLVRHRLFSPKEPRRGRSAFRQQLRRPFAPRLQSKREVQSLVDRGTQMLYFYTGGIENYYNYASQFFDMFSGLDPRGKIEVEYYPNADHTYTFGEDRERMFERVVEWYRSRTWNTN
jgi:pimeloyl-ACP methyl ester carboxylesterase